MKQSNDRLANIKKAAVDTEFVEIGDNQEAKIEELNNLDKKIIGAIAEVSRKAELDQTVEDSLSTGLTSPEFEAASGKIDKKRKVYTSGFKNTLKLKKTGPDLKSTLKLKNVPAEEKNIPTFAFDDEYKKAMKELEEEMTDSFNKLVYSKLAEMNQVILLNDLVDYPLNQDQSKIINSGVVSEGNFNVVAFSDNGYLIQLTNKEEVKTENSFDIKNEKAQYNVIAPNGVILLEKKNYEDALEALDGFSTGYHQSLKEEFNNANPEEPSVAVEDEKEKDLELDDQIGAEGGDLEVVVENNQPENNSDSKMNVDNEISSVDNLVDIDVESNSAIDTNKLELEPSLLFNRYLISKFGGLTKDELASSLKDKDIKRDKVLAWDRGRIGASNIVSFSSVGYMTQLINKDEVRDSDGINVCNNNARYNLIAPSGEIVKQDISYSESQSLLWSESKKYLDEFNKEFETNKENIKTELNYYESEELRDNFINLFEENISNYAKSIGIDVKDLAANKEFSELTSIQQQFALETLRRSSLAKAKVEGHESFVKEKASKSWWKIGFSFNQNYHKERHKAEALKNIESRGLAGYGQTELNWLTKVIKSGPEVKMNVMGGVIVNCLSDESFSESKKWLAEEYNRVARAYIENNSQDKKEEEALQQKLDSIRYKMISDIIDREELKEADMALLKAKNNIDLLKFLSADKETEKLLNKMAETSFNGLTKAGAMINAQKDKAGYAALGFTLRTGTKFAVANSACLASAVSYSVGPAVAAIIGGFRGYNLGKKELLEKEELASLGVKDQSATAKKLNLATGGKEGVSFGLTEKLQNLIDKLRDLNNSLDYSNEKCDDLLKEISLRISYTEKKVNSNSIDYGSLEERNSNYLNLINTLAAAKATVGEGAIHYNSNPLVLR